MRASYLVSVPVVAMPSVVVVIVAYSLDNGGLGGVRCKPCLSRTNAR